VSAHILLSQRPQIMGRWNEAFGSIAHVTTPELALRRAGEGSIVWIEADAPEVWRQIQQARPKLAKVAVTLNPDSSEAMRFLELGAKGYCHLLAVPEMLRQVATVVSNGGLWLGPELMQRAAIAIGHVLQPAGPGNSLLAGLTQREREVALLVANGAANKEVAQQLDITLRTVKAHMGAIFEKLGVRDRLQLVVTLRKATQTH